MDDFDKVQQSRDSEPVGPEKTADILQATFEHYFRMAMDHHTKAGTTSNILLAIVGALLVLVGLDKRMCGAVDLGAALAVCGIGLFGAVWAWKQHERYHFWEHIAYEYQKELTKIVPMLKTGYAYENGAQEAAAEKFGSLFARTILDRYLWVSLHGIVTLIGLGLLAASLQSLTC
jgi:hypothetical protein